MTDKCLYAKSESLRDCYSPYKLLHHKERLESLREGKTVYPAQVTFGLTNLCNHRCPYCYPKGRYADRSRAQMNSGRVIRLLQEIRSAGIKAIQITGAGEPTIHPSFKEILSEVNRTGLRSGFVMNGSGLSPEDAALFECADWARFSVDAASNKTYEAIHGSSSFRKVLSVISALAKKWEDAVIGFSFVIAPANFREIVPAAELAKELGCKNIRFIPAHTEEGIHLFDGIWNECQEMAQKSKLLEDETFSVSAQLDRFFFSKNTQKNFSRCFYQHLSTYIGADGNLYPCCLLQGEYPLGSINRKSFSEVWSAREPISIEKCKAVCSFTRQNELMEYLFKPNPLHVDYV
ncbi:MAG: radical SAM protein [Alphaproteobacteria bacterium]|uniref:Radical SAM protein n=1 Tax=Candidatus Nitrobium versatile TaxID=2884831 RepID=A0A953JEM2_9BACT|nr:radical SAM protein [Candidatus Nitrobium versatile]